MIAELFNEGNRLFDLSELLSYRNGDYDPTATLSKIEDASIRVWASNCDTHFLFHSIGISVGNSTTLCMINSFE